MYSVLLKKDGGLKRVKTNLDLKNLILFPSSFVILSLLFFRALSSRKPRLSRANVGSTNISVLCACQARPEETLPRLFRLPHAS